MIRTLILKAAPISLAIVFFCLLTSLACAQRPRGIETKDRVDEEMTHLRTSRGGSLTIEPAVLLPLGRLENTFSPSPGVNLNFDVGISPHVSWIFGGGAFDLKSKIHPDLRFRLLPAWMGLRWKYRFLPTVETYWGVAGSAYYEYLTFQHDVSAKQDHLTGGGVISSGLNIWFTHWLIAGFQTRIHFISEAHRVFPMMQFGIMVGIRG